MSKQPAPENPPVPVLVENENVGEHGEDAVAIPIAKVGRHEPVVTRKELWAYYRERFLLLA